MKKITYSVTGLHCNACVNRVQKALANVPGVEQVMVDLPSATVEILAKQSLDTSQLNSILEDIGEYRLFEN
ncbi:MAG: heavy metal-associated domain-containing protein [Bacteroides sp.]|jgi:copper chaperone CopZ|nr:heavy metal-associated domain-containing protein [Bacteroides sp.]